MKSVIAILFTFGLISFIGFWYVLVGGSMKLFGTGLGLFTVAIIILCFVFVYQVLRSADLKFAVVFLAYFAAIIITLYGLVIRIVEGMGRYQNPVGFTVFFIGLGLLILLLIGQFLYTFFFFKEPTQSNSIE